MRARYISVLIIILLAGAIVAGSYVLLQTHTSTTSSDCTDLKSVEKTVLTQSRFGSVTTYALPSPQRSPNSITAAPDGSVWFGEVAVPGLAHLFSNGTFIEYPWPFASSTPSSPLCSDRSEIWGVTLWDGLVWASDPANNQLVGMNQTTGAFRVVPLGSSVLPRFIAIDPEDNLWFTETSLPAQIGVVDENLSSIQYYHVPASQGAYTASILFQNASVAYVVTVNPDDNHGQVFSFDPLAPAPVFQQVGGNQTLLGPYSVAVSQGGLWVGEHQASHLAFYDALSNQWSFYPTSTDPKLPLTLPYYLLANDSSLWFNEHDANRIAQLGSNRTALTEYAISSIPIDQIGIGNALTIALDKNLVWFTAWTANMVGFVNDSIAPSFSVTSTSDSTLATMQPGSSAQFQLEVTGSSSRPLNLTFSDSESINSVPQDISFVPSTAAFPSLQGPVDVQVTVTVSAATPPGDYLILMTITDGLTSRSVYVPVEVA